MKNLFKKLGILSGFVAATTILSLAVLVFAQTQLTEVNDMIFRTRNPQIRVSGIAGVRDLAGTSAGQWASARPAIVTTAATRTLLASECGAVIVGNASSGNQVFTLPAVSNVGCMFTFIAGNAAGEVVFKAPATVTCLVNSLPAGATPVIAVTSDTSCEVGGIKNTAASNVLGDTQTIISDGVGWYSVGLGVGVWGLA